MADSEWIAFTVRSGRNGTATILRKVGEQVSKHAKRREIPATQEEIDAEIARRAHLEHSRRALAEFEARSEYRDASLIRNILEFASPDNHVLDRLTPEEWKALRLRLEG